MNGREECELGSIWHESTDRIVDRDRAIEEQLQLIVRASFINIQMFIQATEAYLEYVPQPPMAQDRYVDNEDKRGAKFLVGQQIVLDRVQPDYEQYRSVL